MNAVMSTTEEESLAYAEGKARAAFTVCAAIIALGLEPSAQTRIQYLIRSVMQRGVTDTWSPAMRDGATDWLRRPGSASPRRPASGVPYTTRSSA